MFLCVRELLQLLRTLLSTRDSPTMIAFAYELEPIPRVIVKFHEKSWNLERNRELSRETTKFWELLWNFERNRELSRETVKFWELLWDFERYGVNVLIFMHVSCVCMCMYESCHMNESCHTCEWVLCAWECACYWFKHVSAFCYNI